MINIDKCRLIDHEDQSNIDDIITTQYTFTWLELVVKIFLGDDNGR